MSIQRPIHQARGRKDVSSQSRQPLFERVELSLDRRRGYGERNLFEFLDLSFQPICDVLVVVDDDVDKRVDEMRRIPMSFSVGVPAPLELVQCPGRTCVQDEDVTISNEARDLHGFKLPSEWRSNSSAMRVTSSCVSFETSASAMSKLVRSERRSDRLERSWTSVHPFSADWQTANSIVRQYGEKAACASRVACLVENAIRKGKVATWQSRMS